MYYTSAPPPPSFYEKGVQQGQRVGRKSSSRWPWGLLPTLVVATAVIGSIGWGQRQAEVRPAADTPATLGESTPSAKLAVPRRTFGDLLRERPSFTGWLAGVENGSVILVQPLNGSLNTLVTAANKWYGPISAMVWSPDHTKLAYLTLPDEDAALLTRDVHAYTKKSGLADVPSPEAFPFGRITIVDAASKQVHTSAVEIRNTPKSLVWIDNGTVAAIGQTIITYSVADGQVTTLVEGGNTSSQEQLQSPLAWDALNHALYFTKVKVLPDGQAVRILMQLDTKASQAKELFTLKSGAFDEVTPSAGIDFALAADGKRMAVVSDQGISYVTLADNAVHGLPYREEFAWLQQSLLSDVTWLAPDKIAFTGLSADGSRVWGAWYIPTNDVASIAKGSLAGSWDLADGRLAVVSRDGKTVDIWNPDWSNTTKSTIKSLPLAWSQVSW